MKIGSIYNSLECQHTDTSDRGMESIHTPSLLPQSNVTYTHTPYNSHIPPTLSSATTRILSMLYPCTGYLPLIILRISYRRTPQLLQRLLILRRPQPCRIFECS